MAKTSIRETTLIHSLRYPPLRYVIIADSTLIHATNGRGTTVMKQQRNQEIIHWYVEQSLKGARLIGTAEV